MVGNTITLTGGGATTEAVYTVTSVSGGQVTGLSLTSGGIGYTPCPAPPASPWPRVPEAPPVLVER